MKKHIIHALLALTAVAAFTACQKDNVDEQIERDKKALLGTDVMGAYRNSEGIFLFDDETWQAVYDLDGKVARLQKDDMSQILNIALDGKPAAGVKTTAVSATVGISELKGAAFGCTVLKTSSERMWLWDDDSNIGYIMFWGN